MTNFMIEQRLSVHAFAPRKTFGPFAHHSEALTALLGLLSDVESYTVTEWSSEGGVLRMSITPARQWIRTQLSEE